MRDPLDQRDPYQRAGADLPGTRFLTQMNFKAPLMWATGILFGLMIFGSIGLGIYLIVVHQQIGAANLLFGLALFMAAAIIIPSMLVRRAMSRVFEVGSGLPQKPVNRGGSGTSDPSQRWRAHGAVIRANRARLTHQRDESGPKRRRFRPAFAPSGPLRHNPGWRAGPV